MLHNDGSLAARGIEPPFLNTATGLCLLIGNPARIGYKGEDARRVWAAIYDQSALAVRPSAQPMRFVLCFLPPAPSSQSSTCSPAGGGCSDDSLHQGA